MNGPLLAHEEILSIAHSSRLFYVDFSSSIIHRSPLVNSSDDHSLIFERVSHPYNPSAFESFLHKHGLSSDYSLLPFNL